MTTDELVLPPEDKKARYDFACRAREVELDLFWKRSLFFWGFIGAAFVAFGALRSSPALGVVVSSFGFVCSFIWCMVNRGSKFWYENWEQKVQKSELPFTGQWFASPEPIKPNGAWLRARRFSVSKLAIALSDYVAALWLMLLLSRVAVVLAPAAVSGRARAFAAAAFATMSCAYAFSLIHFAQSDLPRGADDGRRDA